MNTTWAHLRKLANQCVRKATRAREVYLGFQRGQRKCELDSEDETERRVLEGAAGISQDLPRPLFRDK